MNLKSYIKDSYFMLKQYLPIVLFVLAFGFLLAAFKTSYGVLFGIFFIMGLVAIAVAIVLFIVNKCSLNSNYFKCIFNKKVLPYILVSLLVSVFLFVFTNSSKQKLLGIVNSFQQQTDSIVVVNVEHQVSGSLKYFVTCGDSAMVSYLFDTSPIGKTNIEQYTFQVLISADIIVIGACPTISEYNSVEYIKFAFDFYNNQNNKLLTLHDSINDPELKAKLLDGCGDYKTDFSLFNLPIVNNELKIKGLIDTLTNVSKFRLSVSI